MEMLPRLLRQVEPPSSEMAAKLLQGATIRLPGSSTAGKALQPPGIWTAVDHVTPTYGCILPHTSTSRCIGTRAIARMPLQADAWCYIRLQTVACGCMPLHTVIVGACGPGTARWAVGFEESEENAAVVKHCRGRVVGPVSSVGRHGDADISPSRAIVGRRAHDQRPAGGDVRPTAIHATLSESEEGVFAGTDQAWDAEAADGLIQRGDLVACIRAWLVRGTTL